MMGIIEKIEAILNRLIFRFLELMARLIPASIKLYLKKINHRFSVLMTFIKSAPQILYQKIKELFPLIRRNLNLKFLRPKFIEKTINLLKEINEENLNNEKKQKVTFYTRYLVSLIFKDLSGVQVLMLSILSISSIISIILINTSAQKVVQGYIISRTPASVEEEAIYNRPEYYKKELRHVEITNLRLPIFFSEINELKSVDIDFMITTSNRFSRIFIHKHDLHLRDFLLLNLEPILPSLPLDDEGKEIIRQKLIDEINQFLKKHNIEGHVEEVRITYILAN